MATRVIRVDREERINCKLVRIRGCAHAPIEQPTNCKYTCVEWRLGMEINNNVKREEVEAHIREMMAGEQKGKKNRKKTEEWKDNVLNASGPNGVSEVNFERMVKDVLLDRKVIN